MAWHPAFTVGWNGARVGGLLQTWALTIEHDVPSAPAVVSLTAEAELFLEYGDRSGTEPYGARSVGSSVSANVYDTDAGALATALAGAAEADWRVSLAGSDVGDGGLRWVGRIRLDLLDEAAFPEITATPLKLALYDSLAANTERSALLNDDPDPANYLTIADLLAYLTDAAALGAAERHVVAWQANDEPWTDPPTAGLRLLPLVYPGATESVIVDPFESAEGVPAKASEQLTDLCAALDLRTWQAVSAPEGEDAEPCFVTAHPFAIGELAESPLAAYRPTGGALIGADFEYPLFAATTQDVDAAGRKRRLTPPNAVLVERPLRGSVQTVQAGTGSEAQGSGQGGLTADPGFHEWAGGTPQPVAWTVVSGTVTQADGVESGYSAILSDGGKLKGYGPALARDWHSGGYLRAFASASASGSDPYLLWATVVLETFLGATYYLRREYVYDDPVLPADRRVIGYRCAWVAGEPSVPTDPEGDGLLPLVRGGVVQTADQIPTVGTFDEFRSLEAWGLGGRLLQSGTLRLQLYGTDHLPSIDSAELVAGERTLVTGWTTERSADDPNALRIKHSITGVGETPWQSDASGDWLRVLYWQAPLDLSEYDDLALLSAQSVYDDRTDLLPSGAGALYVTLDALIPPERAVTLGGTRYRVGSGCRLDLLKRRTEAVLVPMGKTWTAP